MQPNRRLQWCALGGLSIAVGCSAAPVPLSDYASDLDPNTASALDMFAAGQDIAIGGTPNACEGFEADTFEELAGEDAHKLGPEPYLSIAHVIEAQVVPRDEGGWLALQLRNEAGKERFLRLPTDRPLACLRPATDSIRAAAGERGHFVVFTPWAPSCRHIEATGTRPGAALLGGNPFAPAGIEAVVLDARGKDPWLLLRQGTMRVRADVIANCFSHAKVAPPNPSATTLIRDLGRCAPVAGGSAELLACTSTLGVWEGVANDASVSLDLVHATLGRARFFGDHPVVNERSITTPMESQDLDTLAKNVAGARLLEKKQGGTSSIAGGGLVALPSRAIPIPMGECLLAVAVGDPGATLRLESEDGVFSDKRMKATAFVEACGIELAPGKTAIGLRLGSKEQTSARWALYRTTVAPRATQ